MKFGPFGNKLLCSNFGRISFLNSRFPPELGNFEPRKLCFEFFHLSSFSELDNDLMTSFDYPVDAMEIFKKVTHVFFGKSV